MTPTAFSALHLKPPLLKNLASLGYAGVEIMADIPNYTDLGPVIYVARWVNKITGHFYAFKCWLSCG